MNTSAAEIRSLDDLRAFVRRTLSEKENLLADQFPLREIRLHRHWQTCGRHFELPGPRDVRLSAVWDAARNTVYFYDARGRRFEKLELLQRPESATSCDPA